MPAKISTKMRLFTSSSVFPNPQRLRMFMYEKGIYDEFEEVVYDMSPGGDQRRWPHLKMNPWGETPTLEIPDGTFLSETTGIARYLDQKFTGRKIMGETALDQGLDAMWENRIAVHVLSRLTTMFHVLHQGLGPKLELTHNPAWGEHCRKEAIAHAGLINQHLADGREWLLGGDEPTFSDITFCVAIAFAKLPINATPLDERFEFIDSYWRRWKQEASFQLAYDDGQSGLPELADPEPAIYL